MSHTNLVLGSNWEIHSYPDYVAVSHENRTDYKTYVPERTCTIVHDYGDHVVYSCGHDADSHYDTLYCDKCGAKVVEE